MVPSTAQTDLCSQRIVARAVLQVTSNLARPCWVLSWLASCYLRPTTDMKSTNDDESDLDEDFPMIVDAGPDNEDMDDDE